MKKLDKKLIALLSSALLTNLAMANPAPTGHNSAAVNTADRYGAYQAITLTRNSQDTLFYVEKSDEIKVATTDAYGHSLTKNGVQACSVTGSNQLTRHVVFPQGENTCNLWLTPNTKQIQGISSNTDNVKIFYQYAPGDVFITAGSYTINYGQALYAAGNFTQNGTSELKYVAKYTGKNWQTINNSFSAVKGNKNVHVNAILVGSNGDIYVGGEFNTPHGTSISRFNGTSWDGLNTNSKHLDLNGAINALAITDNTNTKSITLFAAGSLSNRNHAILTYNPKNPIGERWGSLGSKITSGEINTLLVANQTLYIGGSFTSNHGNYITQMDLSIYSLGIPPWKPLHGLKMPSRANVEALGWNNSKNELYIGGYLQGYAPRGMSTRRYNTKTHHVDNITHNSAAGADSILSDNGKLYVGGAVYHGGAKVGATGLIQYQPHYYDGELYYWENVGGISLRYFLQGNIIANPISGNLYIGTYGKNIQYTDNGVYHYNPKTNQAEVLPNTNFNKSAKLAIGNFINITPQ